MEQRRLGNTGSAQLGPTKTYYNYQEGSFEGNVCDIGTRSN